MSNKKSYGVMSSVERQKSFSIFHLSEMLEKKLEMLPFMGSSE